MRETLDVTVYGKTHDDCLVALGDILRSFEDAPVSERRVVDIRYTAETTVCTDGTPNFLVTLWRADATYDAGRPTQ